MADESAQELAKFLTSKDRYGNKSPLEQMLEARITQMAREIAGEVVEATPELADVIRRQVHALIRKALVDDHYLSMTVTSAVAKALHKYAVEDVTDE